MAQGQESAMHFWSPFSALLVYRKQFGIIPTSIFRKRVLVCCACYLLHTPTERRYLLRVPLILDAKKDCSRHALQSPDFSYCEVNPLLFRLPLSPLLLRLQSVCLYRSYRPAARQAAAARWISPHCCSGRKIDLPKYDTGLQGHRIPVNSAVVPCSRYSQGSAGKYITRRLPFCGSRRIHFSRLL